jgi:hypothetical protein
MSMNFKFSRGYGECQLLRSVVVCCYSNTGSADVLLEQQWAAAGVMGHMPHDTGGL